MARKMRNANATRPTTVNVPATAPVLEKKELEAAARDDGVACAVITRVIVDAPPITEVERLVDDELVVVGMIIEDDEEVERMDEGTTAGIDGRLMIGLDGWTGIILDVLLVGGGAAAELCAALDEDLGGPTTTALDVVEL